MDSIQEKVAMKKDPTLKQLEEWTGHRSLMIEQWWVGLGVALFWASIVMLVLLLSSCGGTFELDPVTYKITYKTPMLIQPWK